MIVAIVQARMGSTRLPGKALLDIEGVPMLGRVLDRLHRAERLDKIVVATTRQPRDDAIVTFCNAHGTPVHRGAADDVLNRFLQTAEEEGADVVVRVTSDCPLIDPALVDKVVQACEGVDYASNVMEPRTYPRGLDVEAFTIEALRRADKEDRSPWREHVTPHMYRSGKFQCAAVENDEDLSSHRWTVDTPEDMELARAIYDHFRRDDFTWRDVLKAWKPQWTALNATIRQKTI